MHGKTNILDVIPRLEDDITVTMRNGNMVLSFLSLRRSPLAFLRRFSKRTELELDHMGTATVSLMDGKRHLSDIVNAMQEQFSNEKHLKDRTIMFVIEMKRRKLLKYLSDGLAQQNGKD